ncbi:MAG: NAD(P)/FAD-dependent oxidoreductase [Chloroflexi bacterium]|nr:MAG: NAD(P)/FAD-dependent oxidoreductase [Chloroflexota bacterium]
MKTLLILGGGTGGTMVANRMHELLDSSQWRIIVVDRDEMHYYQPGFLFIPFGVYKPHEVVRPKRNFLPSDVEVVFSDIELIEPDKNQVRLAKDNRVIQYDYLVIATGSHIRPDEIEGMLDGGGWQKNIYDFYTLEGATKLSEFLRTWEGGRLVLNVAEMPIKCPVAPLEFVFLADWFFHERGIRDKVEIVYSTPLSGAFTKPRATAVLGDLLSRKGIDLVADFNISEVDNSKQVIKAWDGREIPYDLLVSIPTNMGAEVIERSEMGDDLNFVPVDKHTLQSTQWENVWIIGDAGNVPASKAGSVAHFMLDVVVENILRHIDGLPPRPDFDGHANCFIETGFDKAVLIDFNYETEPLPGKYPLPGIGPLSLLKETHANHWGKLAFRWLYWNVLLKGGEIPVSSQMQMAGKWAS